MSPQVAKETHVSRRYLNRSFRAQVPDEATDRKYLLRLPGRQLYYEPCSLPRIASADLFGNDLPLDLEIGCGTGEYLCSLARQEPGANFLGVDLHLRSLHHAINIASELGLDNILFVKANFRLMYPVLAPASLRAIYLHFPDPNMKPKFRKRRIFSERFLDEAQRALMPGGRLSVMTDHREFFFDMLRLAERDERWERAHEECYLAGFDPPVKSRYQRIWEGHGLPTLRFELTPSELAGSRTGRDSRGGAVAAIRMQR
jgi:tRNA (guanine-N7-)-methyltransferase